MNILQTDVCGVLIEPRFLHNIPILIKNVLDVLINRKVFFFTGKSKYDFFNEFYKDNDRVEVLKLDTDNFSPTEYNDFLKSRQFWETFINYEHVLTVQTDGCLCDNSPYKIEDFLKYDYIGGFTPYKWWWKETRGLHDWNDFQCFNGGFSLRRVSAMLTVIANYPPLQSRDFTPSLDFKAYGEDLYFVVGLLKLNKNGGRFNVGIDEFATNFCTHTHYVKNTFCVHNLHQCHKSIHLISFLRYCPLYIHFMNFLE